MPYQHPAPRYSKPKPKSKLPYPFNEPRRAWPIRFARDIGSIALELIARERADGMFRIGLGLGVLVGIVSALVMRSI